ncbi:MAG: peptidoglycan D,D-transpeptidase FtsI family protein [Anaerolineae bacterium]
MLRGPDARLRLVSALLIAALVTILAQLVRIQILERDRYQPEVEELLQRPYALALPPSGVILDRNGDLLVGNTPIYDVGAEVNLIGDPATTMSVTQKLAPLLGQDVDTLYQKLLYEHPEDGEDVKVTWRPLANGVGADAGEVLRELKEEGWWWLTLQPKWRRYYTEGALACHTIGFANTDGYGYGVEASQQRFLRPKPASGVGEVGAATEPLAEELAKGELRAYPGTDLVLTIDRTVQAYVEGELDKAIVEFGASGGTILVMNPRTGAILAAANRPGYRPYDYAMYSPNEQDLFVDPAIGVNYEPGSVFKVVTVAAALDSGSVTRDWSYYDNGRLEYGGAVIENSSRQAYGWQNLQGVIDNSLNVGVATLTTQAMGKEVFYDYVRAFGFGKPTGVGLTGEAAGIVRMPTDLEWWDSYLATNAFGQGIAVTPLQMAAAVSAIANEGTIMTPYVVAERRYPDGRVVPTAPRPLWQPISAETANYVAELLANAVANRLTMAQVDGYPIAGKTGTAQIPVSGGYDPVDVITSFIGFGPMPDPQLLILVKIDRPQIEPHLRWGTQTAAPVFKRVAERLFVLLGVPPAGLMAAGP